MSTLLCGMCVIMGVVRSNSIKKTMAWCQVWGHQGPTIHGEWWVTTGRRSACHSAESLYVYEHNRLGSPGKVGHCTGLGE